jgi:hypothetical protein
MAVSVAGYNDQNSETFSREDGAKYLTKPGSTAHSTGCMNAAQNKLRHMLADKPGPLLTLTKKRRESTIRELQEIVSKALAKKMAKKEFKTLVIRKKTWRTKGWGTDKKRKIFRAWVRNKISPKRGKIYVFWKKRECRYVGRTRGSGSRPSQHLKRGWFNGTTRIDVYLTHQRRSIPLLECLAVTAFARRETR